MVSYSLLVNKKTISRKNDNNNEFQNKSVWNTFFNCIIQSHILHIRTIFLIIWAANKRHTDSYCNNKLFWYNLEDIGNERTKLRGRADDLAKIRVFSRNFFFLWNYPNQIRVFSRIFLFLWNHTNPAEVSGGRIATKVCFLLLVVSIPLIFFRDVFFITQSVYHKYVVAKSSGTIQKKYFFLVENLNLWVTTIFIIKIIQLLLSL